MGTSFLQKLRKKNVEVPSQDGAPTQEPNSSTANPTGVSVKGLESATQLKVDIFQTPTAILLYSQVAGAGISDFSVSIEGDNDIVTLKGQRIRPNGDVFPSGENQDMDHVLEECVWGTFYRQIILPSEVDSEGCEAKIKNGVLMLRLPLKGVSDKGTRINVTEA